MASSSSSSSSSTTTLCKATAVYAAVQPLKCYQVDIMAAMKILAIEAWAMPHHEKFMQLREELSAGMGTSAGPQKWTIPAENLEDFLKQLNALGATEVSLPNIGKMSLAELRGVKLSSEDLQVLGPFLALSGEDLGGSS